MAIGQDFYGPADTFARLANQQAAQSLGYGAEAARLADPFATEREGYKNQLRTLMSDPGSFASSPVYKFAYDQGLDALNRSAAARGRIGSGNYLADLQRFGQGLAGQQYFQQADLLSLLSGAKTGSPGYAGAAYQKATERSQDYSSQGAAAKAYGQQGSRNALSNYSSALPSGGISSGGRFSSGMASGGGYGIDPSVYGGRDPASYGGYSGSGAIDTYYPTDAYGGYGYEDSYDPAVFGGYGADYGGYDYGDYGSGGYDLGGYGGDYGGYDYDFSAEDWG